MSLVCSVRWWVLLLFFLCPLMSVTVLVFFVCCIHWWALLFWSVLPNLQIFNVEYNDGYLTTEHALGYQAGRVTNSSGCCLWDWYSHKIKYFLWICLTSWYLWSEMLWTLADSKGFICVTSGSKGFIYIYITSGSKGFIYVTSGSRVI